MVEVPRPQGELSRQPSPVVDLPRLHSLVLYDPPYVSCVPMSDGPRPRVLATSLLCFQHPPRPKKTPGTISSPSSCSHAESNSGRVGCPQSAPQRPVITTYTIRATEIFRDGVWRLDRGRGSERGKHCWRDCWRVARVAVSSGVRPECDGRCNLGIGSEHSLRPSASTGRRCVIACNSGLTCCNPPDQPRRLISLALQPADKVRWSVIYYRDKAVRLCTKGGLCHIQYIRDSGAGNDGFRRHTAFS